MAVSSITNSSSPRPTIEVRQYRPEDHATITKIFVEGLMAFDDNLEYRYLWEERLRKDLTNDFADIEASPGGNFWVAVATKGGASKVVGIIGLQRRSETVGELPTHGNWSEAHDAASWSKQHGIKSLFLTTNPKKKQALAFYAALGYAKVDEVVHFWEDPEYFQVDKLVKQL
ncbi:hypothetical protein PHYSODRAFT_327842 [Phytophthora sojae]|uniref:N-acetyltransferase domain-containing protein n=1 Tax=Phytophthora sojae (strain P6497) TaxID=1094619 RepID=G4Z7D9_PHYSP|nr:hypothetical protein PHYSODRAFT_327842 [Phytophthora sojae]EGZ19647.1 hypothetical protein PHYSODRAFT_327842 [Phytophthora sojae]|eukprot:XP_009522364.1 hypothetical protein PHYSODRAFT_327842 [Phytophthora sojae]